MKKILYLLPLSMAANCFAGQLHNYDQIINAVSKGKYVRLFMNYQKCTLQKGLNKVPNHFAVFTPNAMAVDDEGNIGTYLLYFTMNDPQYPSKPVYQYIKFKISTNNNLQMTLADLNPADYSPLGFEQTINCKIDEGVLIYGGHQFANNQQAINLVK